jgi:hypothetical protein
MLIGFLYVSLDSSTVQLHDMPSLIVIHDTIRGTTHHYKTYGRTDEGISKKSDLWMEAQHFHQHFGNT